MTATRTPSDRPRYGTWIRTRRVWLFVALSVGCLALSLLGLTSSWWWLLLVPAAAFGYIAVVLILTTYRFRHGAQQQIHELLAREVSGMRGRILDVGCGSGALVVTVARAAPGSTVVGADTWGEQWEYSQAQCETNARLEGVDDRVAFRRATASDLPFADGELDAVVSCLTFHEVRECDDRAEPLAEALRVLRPGGRFAFLDLFADPALFASLTHVREVVVRSGCELTTDEPLATLMPLPFPLGGSQVLGHARLMTGTRLLG